jgi:hypothetical protein
VPENKPAESAVKTDIEKQKDTRRSETKVTGNEFRYFCFVIRLLSNLTE